MKKFIFIFFVAMTAIFFIAKENKNDEEIYSLLTNFVTPDEKFWVHRCNSLEKARLMSEKFAGIEIDANFYPEETAGRKFDIAHDYSGKVEISLKEFMPVLAETDKKIWFDFKNLNDDNAADSLKELEILLQNYGVDKSRFIIENHNFRALKNYHDAGFYTSFYVTVKNDLDEENFRAEVREAAESGYIDAVSFPIDYYELVKSTGVEKDFLTWQTRDERWWTFYLKPNLLKMVNDSQVKVILIKMETQFDRY